MANGFADTYGFIYQTGFGTAPVNLSYFYSCQANASYTFYTQSNITNYKDFQSTLDNNSLITPKGCLFFLIIQYPSFAQMLRFEPSQ
jgi:hypothetical protein